MSSERFERVKLALVAILAVIGGAYFWKTYTDIRAVVPAALPGVNTRIDPASAGKPETPDQKSARAHLVAMAAMKRGDFKAVEKTLLPFFFDKPGDRWSLLSNTLARSQVLAGHFTEARRIFEKISSSGMVDTGARRAALLDAARVSYVASEDMAFKFLDAFFREQLAEAAGGDMTPLFSLLSDHLQFDELDRIINHLLEKRLMPPASLEDAAVQQATIMKARGNPDEALLHLKIHLTSIGKTVADLAPLADRLRLAPGTMPPDAYLGREDGAAFIRKGHVTIVQLRSDEPLADQLSYLAASLAPEMKSGFLRYYHPADDPAAAKILSAREIRGEPIPERVTNSEDFTVLRNDPANELLVFGPDGTTIYRGNFIAYRIRLILNGYLRSRSVLGGK